MRKFVYVSGMPEEAEEKQVQESDAMFDRLRRYGGEAAVRDWQSMPLNGDYEDSPQAHQRRMQRGRELLEPYQVQIEADYEREMEPRGIERIGNSAMNLLERARQYEPPSRGIDRIGDYATQMLERARQRRVRGGRG